MGSIDNLVIELLMKIWSGLHGNMKLTQTIDKAFILGYNFDKNGRFIKWSPLLLFYDLDLFDRSLKLPLPTGKTFVNGDYLASISTNQDMIDYYMNDLLQKYSLIQNITSERLNDILMRHLSGQELSLEEDTIIDVLLNYNIDLDQDFIIDKVKIELLSEIIAQVDKVGGIYVTGLSDSFVLEIKDILDIHNAYIPQSGGIKNNVTYNMHLVMNNPKNSVSAYKSIDISVKAFKDPIGNIKETRTFNQDDGHTGSAVTKQGATGKKDVGIAANGTKVYFTLLNYTNQIQDNDEPLDVQELIEDDSFNLQSLSFDYTVEDSREVNGVITPFIRHKHWVANISLIADTIVSDGVVDLYNKLFSEQQHLDNYASYAYERILVDPSITSEQLRKEWRLLGKLYLYNRDASQAVGSFVGMATDNAKDLCLDKINASTELFCMHVYLAMIGCPPDIIVELFSSPEFKDICNRISSDLTTGYKPTIDVNTFSGYPDFYSLYQKAQKVTQISHVLSINQGTSVDEQKLATQVNRLSNIYDEARLKLSIDSNNNITYNYDLFGYPEGDTMMAPLFVQVNNIKAPLVLAAMNEANITLNDPFDMHRFFTDKVYANAVIKIYGLANPNTWNVFDIVDKVPHFHKMFEKYSKVIEGYSSISTLFRYLTSEGKAKYNSDLIKVPTRTVTDPQGMEHQVKIYNLSKQLTSKDIPAIKNAVLNTQFEHFITDVVSQKAAFTYNEQTDSGVIKYDCKFKSDKDIHTFMEFMTSVLIPNLIASHNGNNRFLSRLIPSQQSANNTGMLLYTFSQDLNRITNVEVNGNALLNAIKQDFEEIKNLKITDVLSKDNLNIKDSSIKVGDFLYLYTRLAKLVYPKGRSFERLFTKYENSDFSTLFNQYVADIDAGIIPFDLDPELMMFYICKNKVKWNNAGEKKVIYNRELTYDGVSDYQEFSELKAQGKNNAEMIFQKRIKSDNGNYVITYSKILLGLPSKGISEETRLTARVINDLLNNIEITSVTTKCDL